MVLNIRPTETRRSEEMIHAPAAAGKNTRNAAVINEDGKLQETLRKSCPGKTKEGLKGSGRKRR